MHSYYKLIARDLGTLTHIPGMLAIPTIAVAVFAGEWFVLPGLIIMVLLSLGIGQILYRYGGRHAKEIFSSQPMIVAALGWLIIACLGALPFFGAAWWSNDLSPTTLAFRDPLNAFFESMSGFTSTGLTVAEDPSTLPATLQWWRSLSQWVGAIGVVVLALVIIDPQESSYMLYHSEARTEMIGDNPKTTIRRIWEIYSLYTVLAIIAFLVAGMPWWESINHGLAAIGTGGFAITSDNYQGYNTSIKVVTMLVIIIGAINFYVHYVLLKRRDWQFAFRQSQTRTFAFMLVIGTLLLTLINRIFEPDTLFVDTVFQWITALGTCGFNTVDLATWSEPALWWLTAAMIVGGMAGSTVGGLKIIRLTWLMKAVGWQFNDAWIPEDQEPYYTFNGKKIERQEALESIKSVAALAFLWMFMLGLGTLILLLLIVHEHAPYRVLFEAASALGNVGLGVGITDPNLHPIGRLTLIGLMWMGRLEILGILILLSLPLGRRLIRNNEQGESRNNNQQTEQNNADSSKDQ